MNDLAANELMRAGQSPDVFLQKPTELSQNPYAIPEKLKQTIESTPGLIERYGMDKQLKVLNPHTAVVLDHLNEIMGTEEFTQIVKEQTATQQHTSGDYSYLADLKWGILNKIFTHLGTRVEQYKSGVSSSARFPGDIQSRPQDIPVYELANRLADATEHNNYITLKEGDKPTLDRIRRSFRDLAHLYRTARIDSGNIRDIHAPFQPEGTITEQATGEEILDYFERNRPLAEGVGNYSTQLASDKDGKPPMFVRSLANQSNRMIEHALDMHFPDKELAIEDIPTIVILPGVAQTKEMWQPRIDAYEKKMAEKRVQKSSTLNMKNLTKP